MRRAAARRAALARAHSRASLFDAPVARVRELADLVDDVLAAVGAVPVFAEAVGSRSHAGARSDHSMSPGRRPRPDSPTGSGSARGTAATSDSSTGNTDTDPARTAGSERIDDDHAETWRLVSAAQGGDGEAFGLLYDRYVDTVFRFVYYRVNDRALAEDFTSETFLRALRRIATISYQGRDIGAWLITIARNIVLDHMKSARHRLEMPTGETIEGKDHAQSTENAVLTTLQNEQLMAAVNRLGEDQRECVTLRFIHGLSVSETAEVMGKNDGAIKALQHRAVRKLADLVGGELR